MFRVLGFWVWRYRGFRGFRAWGCGFRVLEFGVEARGLCACVFSYPKTLKPRLENRCRRRRRCCGCLNISGVCWLLPGLGGQQPTCVVSSIYIYIYTESVALQARVLKLSVFPSYRLGCCNCVASICFHAYKKSS